MQNTRQSIRQIIRARRAQLSSQEQQDAARQLVTQCQRVEEFQHQNIALYLSVDGELETRPLIEWLWQQGKNLFLPVIHPFSKGQLLFLHYRPDSRMVANRYGILEPKLAKNDICPIKYLDVICTPLVAFDDKGQRLGMGGGYYDRTLAPWFHQGLGPKPLGIAHDNQWVETLPTEAWDVPLPKIVTPSQIWQWEINQ
ncbi:MULTISPECIES: 5-formyltetrahydrofolate cyclo-ligase [unclassified Vibrio]|uniref:5-formyltetrahydrofolate cyclo-ligase n=1 Tax=Vibrio sp. HB236076 TaxID=3232307 RepID=A0AB39HF73_9VIBR|nr:5-formyltetrahydrofolate cyclo-ligase [Vibrio sp. HB161653]MDP5253937.1 5-formyltetrahydrofolate cyclo-ligase [Vibrio sp. HB161653]